MLEEVVRHAAAALRAVFGRTPVWAAYAPGRVNLIGEHTDYNAGLVLPCAIDRGTAVVAAPRDDGRLRAHSATLAATGELALAQPSATGWLAYPAAVVAAFQEAGLPVRGLDLAVASDLPLESGLSSSAALAVATATLLDAAGGLGLDARRRAELAWRAETAFVGVPCGRMDQMASALGRRGHALRIDCWDFSTRHVPVPRERVRLLIADSGVRRRLAAGGYARRREEAEAALAQARALGLAPPAAETWRDVPPERLPELARRLDPVSARRARHVLTENARVDAACAALQAGDLARVGALLREGQASLRDDYEVSIPELDALCAIGDATPGCYGSRLTGAGFGGCTLHLVEPARAGAVAEALARGFAARFGREPPLLLAEAGDGAAAIPVQEPGPPRAGSGA